MATNEVCKRSIILASSSSARQNLLKRLNIPFNILSPDIDETPLIDESPDNLVERLACQKARVFQQQYPDALIIGSDTIGLLDNKIINKPADMNEAINQLLTYSGKEVEFLTGLCLYDTKSGQSQTAIEKIIVAFRSLSPEIVQRYVEKEDVLNAAGSIKVEGVGIALIEKIICDDYTALIGLPLIRLTKMLERAGVCVV